MTTQSKRNPTFTDTDLMPFGKYKGEPLQDVPASYLRWLWNDGTKDFSRNSTEGDVWLNEKIKLANYIWNSKSAIEQELGEEL